MSKIMTDWSSLVTLILAIVIAVGSLAGWLSGQFSNVRRLLFEEVNSLRRDFLTKIEHHERLDDERFSQIKDAVWSIRLRDAAKAQQEIPPIAK